MEHILRPTDIAIAFSASRPDIGELGATFISKQLISLSGGITQVDTNFKLQAYALILLHSSGHP